ncbi:MAG: GNAT family N-acetyltransferase [Gammaproteobacteria bacterium]|nr:GNAT family N-acetyltransferase [Gammaproteobacteria bacterium]
MSKESVSEIREISIEDIDKINFLSAYLGYESSSIQEATNRLKEILESNSDYVWVYEEDGVIKGWLHLFVALRMASPKFAEIGGLVVDGASRRMGIGRKLVEQAMQWSKSNDFSLRVRCNLNRGDANQFYEDIGFECSKTQKVYQIRPS